MKVMLSLLGLFVFGLASANAKVIWSENFDGLATGDLVVNANPVFGGAAPDVLTNQWAVGGREFSIADAGGGDNVLRMAETGGSRGAAIWLDVSTLGLRAGTTCQMEFTIANYTITGIGGKPPTQFANVLKARGINGVADATVTWDLAKGALFDNTVSANGAEIAVADSYGTSIPPSNTGQINFSNNGTFTHAFTVSENDEYIGLIIANKDRNNEKAAFDITNVSATIPEPEPEPATLGLITA